MGIDNTIQTTVFGSRRMADRQKWDPDNAGDSDKLMVLSWNGGNLDRPCNNDTLLKVLTGNQHVSILQEGWSQRLDQWLYTHAMKSSISCCSSLRVVLGGSGLKGIVNTYDFSIYSEFNCVRRNTTNRKTPHAFFWFTWDIAWFHPVTHQLLSRGHHNHYRVTSIHYNNDSAKKARFSLCVTVRPHDHCHPGRARPCRL